MATLTQSDYYGIAEAIANVMNKGGVGSPFSRTRPPSITNKSVKNLGELEDLSTGFSGMLKHWTDGLKKSSDEFNAMRTVQRAYLKSLEEYAKNLNDMGKKSMNSMTKFLSQNSGNNKKIQQGMDVLGKYSASITKLKSAISGGDSKQINAAWREQLSAAREAKDAGFTVTAARVKTGIGYKMSDKGVREKIATYDIKNIGNLDATQEASDKFESISHDMAEDLQRAYKYEIESRYAATKVLISNIFKLADEFGQITDSRLKNLQSSTDFFNAALNGMTAPEMNEWMNANRITQKLMQDSGGNFYDSTREMLKHAGYFGKDLMEMQTKIGNSLMNAGIKPTMEASKKFLDTVNSVQMLGGMDRDSAVKAVQDTLHSDFFMASSVGKTDQEQLALLQEQAISQQRMVKELGISNEYLDQQRQEALHNRYGDVLTNLKNVMVMRQGFSRMEASGIQISDSDKDVILKSIAGSLDANSAEVLAAKARIGAQLSPRLTAASNDMVTNGITGNVIDAIAMQKVTGIGGQDTSSWAKMSDVSSARRDTTGAVAAAMNNEYLAKASKGAADSLGYLEQKMREFTTGAKGVAGLPGVGSGAFSNILGVVGQGFTDAIFNSMFRKGGLTRGLGNIWGNVKGIGRGFGSAGKWGAGLMRTGMASEGMLAGGVGAGVSTAAALGGIAVTGLSLYKLYNTLKDPNATEKDKDRAQGQAIGAAAGLAIGAAVGSVIPGLGTAIGAALGSGLGAWIGNSVGAEWKSFNEDSNKIAVKTAVGVSTAWDDYKKGIAANGGISFDNIGTTFKLYKDVGGALLSGWWDQQVNQLSHGWNVVKDMFSSENGVVKDVSAAFGEVKDGIFGSSETDENTNLLSQIAYNTAKTPEIGLKQIEAGKQLAAEQNQRANYADAKKNNAASVVNQWKERGSSYLENRLAGYSDALSNST